MAVKTYRLGPGVDANRYATLFEADQTASNRTASDSWTVAKVAAGVAADWHTDGIVGSLAFDAASAHPDATVGWAASGSRSSATTGPLTGTFANTAWTFTFAVRAGTASAQAGRIRLRVFKAAAANPLTANVTELTSAAQVGTTSAALSTTADVTSIVTWNPGTTITLANEYLFFELAWEITTASGSNNGNVILRTGQAAGGSRIVTPDLSVGAAVEKKTRIISSPVAVRTAAVR